MVVSFDALQYFRGLVTMVDGAFDPLHAGHIDYIRQARAIGRPLLCNLAPDAYIRSKHPVLLPGWQRLAVIDALRDVSYAHLSDAGTEAVLEHLRPYAYVKGQDWEGTLPEAQTAICKRLGIRVVFLKTVSESSSRLLRAAAVAGAPAMSEDQPATSRHGS